MDRARYTYIEHLKGARLVQETFNSATSQSFQKSNIENIHLQCKNEELNQAFLTQSYVICRRQMTRKVIQEHQGLLNKLFQ